MLLTRSPRLHALFCCIALLAAASCGSGSDESNAPSASSAEQDLAPGSLADVQRILPASVRALEFLSALVGPERLAGLPEQGFEYATLGAEEQRFASLPRFDTYLAEPILALRPELVLCDPWQQIETNERLREAGVRVLVLPDTVTWRDGARVLTELGDKLGVPEKAAAAVAGLERRVEALAAGAVARRGLRAVPYSNFGSQGFSAGESTTIDEILKLAGLRNAVSESGRKGHLNLSFEELLVLDPDLIVVSTPLHTDVGHAGDRGGASRTVLLAEPALSKLRAVREDRIVGISPGHYACASQRVVDAAEALAQAVDRMLAANPERQR
jgi:iron complex transport system substrate-binding protein